MPVRFVIQVFVLAALLLMTACSGSSDSQGVPDNTNNQQEQTNPTDNNQNNQNDQTNQNDSAPQSYVWDAADFTHVYDVGPGKAYPDPGQVPWEELGPSTLVRIYYRDTPYRNKFVLTTTATSDEPLVVTGIPDNGRLPVISGEDAVTRTTMYYLNEPRSVVKVGNYTGQSDSDMPAHVYIQNLDIRSGRPSFSFTNRNGTTENYSRNAAAVHIEDGENITIVGCDLHDCGNGLFSTHFSRNVLIRQNHIYDNGIEGRYYEHNSYTGSQGIVFEYNHYGQLRAGCDGNNLKDRSSGTIIRYNWIEGGNRQLDLVETGHDNIFNDPAYDETFVYGNVLIEMDGEGNSQVLHYGGDGSDRSMYRKGHLYFYHNTVVSTRSGNTTLMRLSTIDENAVVNNNILMVTAGGSRLAITSGSGQTALENNWISSGWRNTHESSMDAGASVSDLGNMEGDAPGFSDQDGEDFSLNANSRCVGGADALPGETAPYPVVQEYVKHQGGEARPTDGSPDIGAFEN